MSTETVNKYQIYCETEAEWKYVWGTEPPTTCPTDTAHTVNLDSVAIVETVSSNDVTVHQPTKGNFMMESFPLTISSVSPPTTVSDSITFEEKVLLWTTEFYATSDMIGDTFNVIANPDTPVGALTATGNLGDTVINVSSTVTGNVVPGMYLKAYDTTASPPVLQDLGRVKAVDGDAGTVTVKNSLTNIFPPGTILLLNIYLGRNMVITYAGSHKLVDKGFQGKLLPAGTTLTMFYYNSNGQEKIINWELGYYYGFD